MAIVQDFSRWYRGAVAPFGDAAAFAVLPAPSGTPGYSGGAQVQVASALASSGGSSVPAYAGSASRSVPRSLSASGVSATPPGGTASLASSHALAAAGGSTPPAYSGSTTLVVARSLASSGSRGLPATGSAGLAVGRAFASAGAATPPVFTGHIDVECHPEVIPGCFGGAGLLVEVAFSSGGSYTPTFAGTAAPEVRLAVASEAGLANPPGGTASLLLPGRVLAASGSSTAPIYAGTAAVSPPRSASSGGSYAFTHLADAAVSARPAMDASGARSLPASAGAELSVSATAAASGSWSSPPSGSSTLAVSASIQASGSLFGAPGNYAGVLVAAPIRPVLAASGGNKFDRFVFRVVVDMVRGDEVTPAIALQVGDVGVPFQAQLQTPEGRVIDVSESTVRTFRFQKPDGVLIEREASLLTDGRDGILTYDFAEGDLDLAGTWRFQLVVGFGGDVKSGEIKKFKVYGNLPTGA